MMNYMLTISVRREQSEHLDKSRYATLGISVIRYNLKLTHSIICTEEDFLYRFMIIAALSHSVYKYETRNLKSNLFRR